jgi:tetratricopeptide (TPR) repeat protein
MAAKDTITVFDQQGQPRELPRQEFLEKVLPKLLEAAWGNADQLYQQIVFALENGLHDGVVKAAERLDELDGGAERGKVLLSATQFQTGQHDAAEATLRASLEKNGESSIAVVNLARMRQARGDVDGAQTLLSRALELDANQENALGWSCQLMQEAGGEEAVVEFLEDLSKGPGNWRATY